MGSQGTYYFNHFLSFEFFQIIFTLYKESGF